MNSPRTVQAGGFSNRLNKYPSLQELLLLVVVLNFTTFCILYKPMLEEFFTFSSLFSSDLLNTSISSSILFSIVQNIHEDSLKQHSNHLLQTDVYFLILALTLPIGNNL